MCSIYSWRVGRVSSIFFCLPDKARLTHGSSPIIELPSFLWRQPSQRNFSFEQSAIEHEPRQRHSQLTWKLTAWKDAQLTLSLFVASSESTSLSSCMPKTAYCNFMPMITKCWRVAATWFHCVSPLFILPAKNTDTPVRLPAFTDQSDMAVAIGIMHGCGYTYP